MSDALKGPYALTWALAVLMIVQSALGVLVRDQYRDVEWIKATWLGNDWVTLVVATPLLIAAMLSARRGVVQGVLLWLGVVAYAVYNYAFYLFGAALNVFFPLYVVALGVSGVTLVLAWPRVDPAQVAASFRPTTPVRLIGGYLVFVGVGLASVWITMWAAYVFAGQPPPAGAEAFKLVAALDLLLMVTVLTSGGVLLWRRRKWGYVVAALACTQASLYLLVLSVNSIVAIGRGLARAPGEFPMWGTLTVLTTAITFLLMTNVRHERTRS